MRARWSWAAAGRPAGQDELNQRLELGLERVDRLFEMLDVLVGDGVVKRAVRERIGQRRADDEQLVLELGDQLIGRRHPGRGPAPRRARR